MIVARKKNTAGDNEPWYNISELGGGAPGLSVHLSHETKEIYYYFSPYAEDDSSISWIDYVKTVWQQNNILLTDEQAQDIVTEIQQIFANSMKKWDNIYYYSHNANGDKSAKKIINVIQGDQTNYNVIIYPTNSDTVAFIPVGDVIQMQPPIENKHYHRADFTIYIGINAFFDILENPDTVNSAKSIAFRENAGAHEIGHVLGLSELDAFQCQCTCDNCTDDDKTNDCLGHHEEALMGYGEYANRVTHITYRDIAGVSITRGFHTDNNHLWMLRTNDDGTQDVICALCNGVRKNISLTDGAYEGQTPKEIGWCNDEHSVTGANMLLVATDGTRDFYLWATELPASNVDV